MPTANAKRAVIIGAGIAGTATAIALRKAGWQAALFEAHPNAAEDIGAFLTLAGNGMRALAELDATDPVTAVGFPLTSLRVLDARGTELAHAPLGDVAEPALRYRCLRRGELNAALQAEAVRRGIPLRHGARLVSLSDGPAGVTARFADGTTATADVLIGADGLNSTVRRLIAPGSRPGYAGQRVFYGCTGTAPATDGTGHITMVRGSAAAFGFAVSPAGETYWFARVAGEPLTTRELARPAPDVWRNQLIPLLREDSTPAAGIVAAPTGTVMVTNATEMPLGTPWHSGRTLLVGDAAHAASPATGQGASTALEDAVILAKALRDSPDPHTAFTLYDACRRPRVERNITVSGGISRAGHAPGSPATSPPAPRTDDDTLHRQLAWDTSLG
ncbi:FAD-dependent oxidoreductase [Streptomyces sp. L2]|uniref:FAD-dependent oxidoreductase n=1 Tax=Streptomyces sp. L2 TaxID=2162665 RepID=UPI001010A6B8|nr:FAD-dependent oxidoreductase [Streptomyces sp. L2]